MTHVPYRVTGQLVTDLITGAVPLSFQLIPNVIGQVRAGDVRPLAVTAKVRSACLPDVPTTAEAGLPGYECAGWFALLAPKGTPKAIVETLHAAAGRALADAGIRQRLIDMGADPSASTPAELAQLISAEIVKWREVIVAAKLQPE